MDRPVVQLDRKRANVLRSYRHPWVFSKGLAEKPDLPPGALVRVVCGKDHLGWAFYHPRNSIGLRMISFEERMPDRDFWRDRLRRALGLRKSALPGRSCYRLVHGENDGFPGLTADVYGPLLCIQVTTAGMENLKAEMAEWMAEATGAAAVYERSEGHARNQEGLAPANGFLMGEVSLPIEIEERGLFYAVDPATGHKTGFYLDQTDQRAWVEAHSKGKRVLDLCCYSGGFTLSALRGGAAEVLSVDSSAPVLELLAKNIERNGLATGKQRSHRADVFEFLKQNPDQTWDLVILDPPALAKSVRAEERARRAYRGLNRAACGWVAEGGRLLTFSCSGVVATETFRQSVFLGVRDSGRDAVIVGRFGAGPDHPVHLCFPEGEYLKGLALYFY